MLSVRLTHVSLRSCSSLIPFASHGVRGRILEQPGCTNTAQGTEKKGGSLCARSRAVRVPGVAGDVRKELQLLAEVQAEANASDATVSTSGPMQSVA